MTDTHTSGRTLSVRRHFSAPLAMVREAFANPDQLDRWWGPEGFSITTFEMDQRTGGVWRFTMHGPDGTDYPNFVKYTEVSERKIAWDQGTDEVNILHRGVVEFSETDGGTDVAFAITFDSEEIFRLAVEKYGADDGMHGTHNRLAILLGDLTGKPAGLQVTLPNDLTIRMTRRFRAPKASVFEVFTNPEHMKNWWGPHGYVIEVMESDRRVGGQWRSVQRNPKGERFSFHGEILALDPPNSTKQTFIFDAWPDAVSTESAEFIEDHGHTMVVVRSVFNSVEERDGMVNSGMEKGAAESYERLDAVLEALQK